MDEEKLRELLRQLKRWIKRLSINNQLVFNMENTNLKLAPKMAQVYWCEFSPPVFPELGKIRPVVVLSRQNTLHGMVTVAPITTRPQRNIEKKHWAKIQAPFETNENAWVLCKHITAVSTRRLRIHKRDTEREVITEIPEVKLREIVQKIQNDFSKRNVKDL